MIFRIYFSVLYDGVFDVDICCFRLKTCQPAYVRYIFTKLYDIGYADIMPLEDKNAHYMYV